MPDKVITNPLNKISVSFTWDDNSIRHHSLLAPLFLDNGFRCTFYVVTGDEKYDSDYRDKYKQLLTNGFEIGSHSFSHHYISSLSPGDASAELKMSVKKILEQFGVYPLTFAFPNHDYNETLIELAREFHLETRNTLTNAKRFSIKTHTSLAELQDAINDAYINRINLVFSGHSLITEEEYSCKLPGEGYQPMRISLLTELLPYLKTIESKVDMVTFAQSALREWIKKMRVFIGDEWVIPKEQLRQLEKFRITDENIVSLL
jgi:peptidoglycan/xylan/chitin deacetylase (PgdA/CDA1 family)